MKGMLTHNVSAISAASGIEEKQVEANFPQYFQEVEANNGKCKSFDLIGTVERRSGEYHLSAVRFNCEKSAVVKLIVWHENELSGFRDLPDGNTKSFDHVKANEFFSDSNDRGLAFDDADGKPVMRIKTATREILARKRARES